MKEGLGCGMCLSQMCSHSRDNWCSISSSVLVFPWRPGLGTGQCSGFIARLLQKYYSSECSGWIWPFHLIRLYCKAWQIGGREGGSVFHFLIKIKMQKQPSDEAIWILLLQTK